MPPKSSSQRRMTQSQNNDQVYNLGVAGRKTGLTLADRQRDEHGFEKMDDLFSSPEKDVNNPALNGANGKGHEDSEEEQTMEIDDESQMGPATIMKQRKNRPSLPRARSPIKTHLQSPARQNPHLGPTSSPTRGSIVTARERSPPRSVNRRLDFSQRSQRQAKPTMTSHLKYYSKKAQNGKITKGHARASDSDDGEVNLQGRTGQPEEEEGEDDREESPLHVDEEVVQVDDEQVGPTIEPEPEAEDDQEEQVQESRSAPQPKKRRGRKAKAPTAQQEEGEPSIVEAAPEEVEQVAEEPIKKKRGRPARVAQSPEEPRPAKKSPKRRRSGRNSSGSAAENQEQEQEEEQEQEDNVERRVTKRQRTEKKETKNTSSKPTTTKEKAKPGRKRKSSGIGVEEPIVQRGPPLPKGRGLVALRREEEEMMRTTRSGRLSYKPLEFWKGEHKVYDTASQHVFEDKSGRFVMPEVKGVVRAAEESYSQPKKRRGRPATKGAKATRRSVIEEEEERDDWEYNPGEIMGEVLPWRSEHDIDMDDEEPETIDDQIAISEGAIELKDIRGAKFRFAKTSTLPFFGTGVVDMPPGAEKRTKNCRRMQMVFFVHAGSVDVTVHKTEFRIGKGSMWFVPRGNYYSISNNTDQPARIFFAQGCEMVAEQEHEETQFLS
ncbi:Mif2/CENP-C like-domain-containing protein [Hypoxylon sp. NC1633]|nr:Mif2/CENP-C like-domain-containing protein [Hypoxylon sp. NC1633]